LTTTGKHKKSDPSPLSRRTANGGPITTTAHSKLLGGKGQRGKVQNAKTWN